MSDLQNRLDRQTPPDFDRAALWERIGRPRRRRRRFLLLFWLGILLVSVVGGAVWFSNAGWPGDDAVEVVGHDIDKLYDLEEGGTGVPLADQAAAKEKSEAGSRVGLVKKEETPRQTLSTNTGGYEGSKVLNAEPSPESTKQQNSILAPVPDKAMNNSTDARSPLTPLVYENHEALTQGRADDGLAIPGRVAELSFLPNGPIDLINREARSYHFSTLGSQEPVDFKRNEFTIVIGAAGQLHRFSCSDRADEATRLGYALGAAYKRRLTPRWYLLAEVQYNQHHSKVETSTFYTEKILAASNEIEVLTTTTYYQLYNAYHRLDLSAGAGHSWKFRGLDIGLDLSIGAAKWLVIEGNYLDEAGTLREMNNAGSLDLMLFGKLSGSVSKRLTNDFFIGSDISVQTPLQVSDAPNGCTQMIVPVYIGLSLGKQF